MIFNIEPFQYLLELCFFLIEVFIFLNISIMTKSKNVVWSSLFFFSETSKELILLNMVKLMELMIVIDRFP